MACLQQVFARPIVPSTTFQMPTAKTDAAGGDMKEEEISEQQIAKIVEEDKTETSSGSNSASEVTGAATRVAGAGHLPAAPAGAAHLPVAAGGAPVLSLSEASRKIVQYTVTAVFGAGTLASAGLAFYYRNQQGQFSAPPNQDPGAAQAAGDQAALCAGMTAAGVVVTSLACCADIIYTKCKDLANA